jgi:hypothetical protein
MISLLKLLTEIKRVSRRIPVFKSVDNDNDNTDKFNYILILDKYKIFMRDNYEDGNSVLIYFDARNKRKKIIFKQFLDDNNIEYEFKDYGTDRVFRIDKIYLKIVGERKANFGKYGMFGKDIDYEDIDEVKRIPYQFKAEVISSSLNRIKVYFNNTYIVANAYPDLNQVQIEYAGHIGRYDEKYGEFISFLIDKGIPFDRDTTSQMEEVLNISMAYFDIKDGELLSEVKRISQIPLKRGSPSIPHTSFMYRKKLNLDFYFELEDGEKVHVRSWKRKHMVVQHELKINPTRIIEFLKNHGIEYQFGDDEGHYGAYIFIKNIYFTFPEKLDEVKRISYQFSLINSKTGLKVRINNKIFKLFNYTKDFYYIYVTDNFYESIIDFLKKNNIDFLEQRADDTAKYVIIHSMYFKDIDNMYGSPF